MIELATLARIVYGSRVKNLPFPHTCVLRSRRIESFAKFIYDSRSGHGLSYEGTRVDGCAVQQTTVN